MNEWIDCSGILTKPYRMDVEMTLALLHFDCCQMDICEHEYNILYILLENTLTLLRNTLGKVTDHFTANGHFVNRSQQTVN